SGFGARVQLSQRCRDFRRAHQCALEEGARELFKEWGFRSLVSRLPKAEVPKSQQALF
ncbi:hypothetical protein HY374_00930, partial [Candidatus Berkelbacteria bacterium]|nr:hypothetical protein [Candidatus Berkelbacteria bacterium]